MRLGCQVAQCRADANRRCKNSQMIDPGRDKAKNSQAKEGDNEKMP
jgi:hypothetical protein